MQSVLFITFQHDNDEPVKDKLAVLVFFAQTRCKFAHNALHWAKHLSHVTHIFVATKHASNKFFLGIWRKARDIVKDSNT